MPKAKAVDPHRRPGSPHGTAGALPPHRWRTILVLPRSPGPSSAACIGSWHLNQFPVSLHLGRDQGAEGVQVTSLTAEIFPKQRELKTNLCLCALGKDISTRRELRACSIEGPPLLGTLFSKPLVRDPQDHKPSRESTESTWDLCRATRDRGYPGPVPVPRTYTRAAQSQDGRTHVAPWPHLTHLYLRLPAPAPRGGPGSTPFPFLCRDPDLVRRAAHLLCSPPLSASAGALGFLVHSKYTTYSSSRLNLRRRRPRSQGDTPKRRCPVTSAKRREQPGKAVRGKEEEFPRGKPRERSSPSRERPDRTRGISLAATRLWSSRPLRLRPKGTPGSRCDGSLDCTRKPQGNSNPVPWKSGSCYIPSPDRLWVGDAKRSQLGASLKHRCFSSGFKDTLR